MKSLTFIVGAAAAIGMAAAVSAAPAPDRIQLAQAQQSDTQSGAGKGANQRNTGNREGGAAATGASQNGGKGPPQRIGARASGRQPFAFSGTPIYSTTSSARASSVGGSERPSALAVLRFITSSYLVGACTGRSAGLSPLRIRST